MALSPVALAYVSNLGLAVFLGVLGVLVLRGSPDRAARGPLAVFLGLVAANYSLDALSFIVPNGWTSPVALRYAALVAVLLDPPAFLAFALAVTGRRLTPGRVALAALPAAPAIVAFALAPPSFPFLLDWTYRWLYAPALASCYGASFLLIASRYLRETRSLQRDRFGALVVAFGIVVLPRIPLIYVDLGLHRGAGVALLEPSGVLSLLAGLGVVSVAAYAWARTRVVAANRDHFRGTARALGGLIAVVAGVWTLHLLPALHAAAFGLLFSARWFLFAAVFSVGVRRFDVLDLPESNHVRLSRALVASVLALALAEVAAVLAAIPGTSLTTALAGSAAVVGVGGGVYAALRHAVPGPLPDESWRHLAVYRAHVELGTPVDELEPIRERLGVSDRAARRIRDLVEMERAVAERSPAVEIAEGKSVLGRYDVGRFLGVGSFGRAFLAKDRVAGERVVLKELLAEWRHDPEALERFRREAETMLAVEHPALVGFRGLETLPTGHLLVLQYVEGPTLRERLASGPLSSREAASLARDVLAGLAALHAAGIVHRDVKPENLVLRPDGRAVLLDFGAATAKAGGTRLAQGAGHPGTRAYMSPEQARGDPVTGSSDLYSFGVVLREALAGPAHARGTVPPRWTAALARATSEDPTARYATAREFLEDVPDD